MKNNLKNYISFILVVLGILFFASCDESEFLNRYPLDSPSPDVFFVNEASARMAVTAAYEPWRRSSHSYRRDLVIMTDALSDDAYWRPSRAASIAFSQWKINSGDGTAQAYWQFGFESVNAANFAIEHIPSLLEKGLTQSQIDPYIAEAHFMRGFAYMFLTTFFGDVPLHDKPRGSFEEFDQPRSPVADIYNQIIADFTLAREKLPEKQPAAYTGAPTKATAAAYLAKALLYNKKYSEAETAARTAINIAESSGYQLIDDYASIFTHENEGNPELLFCIQFIDNSRDFGNNYMIQRITRNCPPEFIHVYGMAGWGYALPTRDLFDAYELGDPRRECTIHYPGATYGIYGAGVPFTYSHRSYNDQGVVESYEKVYTDGVPIDYDYRWSETGMNVKKSTRNVAHLQDVYSDGLDVPLMRMADLYLILAEALAEQNKDEALVWVNKVRARPSVNMPAKTAADGSLRDIVRHERRVELAMEGHRIWDLLRWGIMKQTFGNGDKVKKHFFCDYLTDQFTRFCMPELNNYPGDLVLLPIPQREIDRNSQITNNNPGY
jgi:starch-binding outer membrane protein, SusD/RagB family